MKEPLSHNENNSTFLALRYTNLETGIFRDGSKFRITL